MDAKDEPVPTETQLAELSALADGTLAAERRPALEALLESSLALREQFELERRLVERLHAARATDRAPIALRERIESERDRARGAQARGLTGRARRWLAPWPIAGLSGAVAAVVAVIVVLAGGSGGLTVSSAAQLAQRGPAGGKPALAPGDRAVLATHVGAVRFPARLGSLSVTGQRTDRLDGRRVVTVYYAGDGTTVAYSVLAKPALAQEVNWHVGAVAYYVGTLRGRAALVWRNGGHTCIISAAGIAPQTLRRLLV